MDVFEIMTEEKWQSRLAKLFEKTGLAMSLTDADGKILLSAGERNPLCTRIREKEETLVSFCSKTNTAMTAQVKKSKRSVGEYCEGGLIRVAVPILSAGEVVAQITGCGAKGDPEEIDAFYLSQEMGVTEAEVETLAKDIKPNPEFSIEALKDELTALVAAGEN